MALIVDFLRALAQVLDGRFLGVLARAVLVAALILVGFAIGAGWLVGLLPDTVALPLVGEVAVPLRQVQGLTIVLIIVLSSFLMFPTAAAVVSFYLDDVVDAVEARHYPELPELRHSGILEMLLGAVAFSLIVIMVNLGALMFYVMSGALAPLVFWAVNGFLIGREYFTLVAGRRLPPAEVAGMRREHGWRIWAAGFMMAVPLSLPGLGLLLPVLGVATYTHMFHRLRRAEAPSVPTAA